MQQTIWFYARYYGLLIYEIFRRKQARKKMWSLYWEVYICVDDAKRKYSGSRMSKQRRLQKSIDANLQLIRTIMDHIIKVEGRKSK